MTGQIKNMFIGLFVIVACLLIVGLILFIEPGVGDGKQIIRVHFTNINGISVGTRVLLAGKQVGEVASIEEVPQARTQKLDEFGHVYFYLVTLKIDSHVTVFASDKFTTSTSGLLGEKAVNIIPEPFKKGSTHMVLSESSQVYADSGDLLENAFNELAALSEKVEEALDHVIDWMNEYGHDVGSAVQSFGNASSEIARAAKTFNDLKVPQEIHETVTAMNNTFSSVNNMIAELEESHFSYNISSIANNINDVSSIMAQGKGTVGKLFMEDTIYIQASSAMSKINMIMDDINNYGLVFWQNKHWQREREQRVAAYQSLRNPKDFSRYITEESNAINQSLSRLIVLADQATETDNQDAFIDNKSLWKNLEELKQQLDVLQNNVEYYIQALNAEIEKAQ